MDKAFTHFQHVLRLAPDHQKAKDVYKVSEADTYTYFLPKYDFHLSYNTTNWLKY